jgi:hypothetical protein
MLLQLVGAVAIVGLFVGCCPRSGARRLLQCGPWRMGREVLKTVPDKKPSTDPWKNIRQAPTDRHRHNKRADRNTFVRGLKGHKGDSNICSADRERRQIHRWRNSDEGSLKAAAAIGCRGIRYCKVAHSAARADRRSLRSGLRCKADIQTSATPEVRRTAA